MSMTQTAAKLAICGWERSGTMKKNGPNIFDSQLHLLCRIQSGPKRAIARACLDCVTMAGALFGAVLATLIVGL